MKKLKLFFACLLMAVLSIGQVWADVESGTTYTTDPKTPSVPANWTVNSYANDANYTKLASNTNYIQTDEFCQNGFTSIKIKARKFGGPSAAQAVISVEWFENGGSSTVLATVSPTGTSLVDYTLSELESVTGNKSGYIKISCKEASGGKGCGVSQVTITYTAGTCGGGTPTCATPTFLPAAGSYEGTQNVTISSTADATIYYTTDDSDPTTSGTRQTYSSPIAVSADMTIKAYAVKAEYDNSEVATAAYEITEGPDVTLNLIDGNWSFPTSGGTSLTEYTNSETGYKVSCYAANEYKVNGSNYFIIGKSGSYILLPEFANPVEKIVVVGNSGGSGSVVFNIYDGETAVSTAVTGCTSDQTFEIEDPAANKQYTLKVTSAHNLQLKAIKIYFGAAPAVAKPTISGDENFVTSTTVTLACSTTGAEIYYTTDGSDPKTSGSIGTSFSLTETKTVRAIAKLGSDWSAEATKTFTKVTALETMADVQAAATSSETEDVINVAISNWVVTAVNGGQAWIAAPDNLKGILLYKSGHGFAAGNKLSGLVVGTKIKLYNDYPELTSLAASEVSVSSADAISARTTTIAALTSGHPAEQGTIVKLENLTYTASSTSFSDGENSIQIDTKLYSPALVDGASYTITGVVEYLASSVIKIMPRSADDVEGGASLPEVTGLAALKAEATGVSYLLNLTDAVVTLVDGSNAFIEDATAGALIYKSGHGFSAGDKLNGQYEVTTATYQGKFEITAITAQTGATTTPGADIPVTTLTIAQLNANFAANESKRIKIVGVNVIDAIGTSDRNGEISDGENSVILYAGKSGVSAALNANIDAIGYPTPYVKDEINQQQFAVWAQADITINVKEDPELAYNPAVVNVLLSDLASFTPADLEYATGFDGLAAITYESSDPSIATVETDGTVTLVATEEGSTTITATFAGNATYKADNASYTINVSATPIAPVYTMSFDMTRASYDAAADAQVVWNSSVVTMTVDKGTSSTKANNYIGGGYNGTTLCADSRFYPGSIITFAPASGVTITKVEWTATSNSYASNLVGATWTNASATAEGTIVTIVPSASGDFSAEIAASKQARATAVTVYYEAESEKAKLAASISIDNINTSVGEDDIVLLDIAATSNPNKNAISYAITSGTAVSLVGEGKAAAFHAVEEGTATITATIPNDLGNYTGATTTFEITVSAAATLESIVISGEASVLEYTAGQTFNPAGLVVTGHYSDNTDAEITSGIDWTFDPATLSEGDASVSVTATVGSIFSPAFVVNGLTVSAPAPLGDSYVKVTASQADWSGDYLLVYEDGEDAYVWNGDYSDGASNYASATISSNTIAKPAAAAVITIAAASEGKYTLQVNGDKYFQDNGSNSKLIFTDAIADAAEVTISYETDWTKLLFSERCIRFNNASGQTRFRFYAASSQQAVQLYKKDVPVKDLIRGGLSDGKWGTLCPAQNVENVEGAVFYLLSYLEEDELGNPYNVVFDEIVGPNLQAGKPYFFIANAEEIRGNKTGEPLDAADPAGVNGFYGYIGASSMALTVWHDAYDEDEDNTFVIYDNKVVRINQTGTMLPSERCYININKEVPSRTAVAKTYGRRRITVGVSGTNAAQGFENLDASEKPLKVMIEGTLYILRGEKVYDATGRLVK